MTFKEWITILEKDEMKIPFYMKHSSDVSKNTKNAIILRVGAIDFYNTEQYVFQKCNKPISKILCINTKNKNKI